MIQSHCRPDLLLAPGRTTRDRMRIIDSLRLKDIPSVVGGHTKPILECGKGPGPTPTNS